MISLSLSIFMPPDKPKHSRKTAERKKRVGEAVEALTALQFGPKQRNETAAYVLLALLDLQPWAAWSEAQAPLRGITPIIGFIATAYGNRYAPNTRETIRDDAVKFFVERACYSVIRMIPIAQQIAERPCTRSNPLPLLSSVISELWIGHLR